MLEDLVCKAHRPVRSMMHFGLNKFVQSMFSHDTLLSLDTKGT